jgi:predicted DNA-binding transcriptional regulator YafY
MKRTINQILRDSFRSRKNVKIRYYGLSSDETKYRVISIYKLENDFLIEFCHLRKEERTFVKDRIQFAKKLDEGYEIPKGWKPKCKVW